MSTHYGKIRVFVHKLGKMASTLSDDGFEVSNEYQIFEATLISDAKETEWADVITEEIRCTGFELFADSIAQIIEPYKIGAVIEILADAELEYTKSETLDGTEYDCVGSLLNEKHRKLLKKEIKRFAPDLAGTQKKKEPKRV